MQRFDENQGVPQKYLVHKNGPDVQTQNIMLSRLAIANNETLLSQFSYFLSTFYLPNDGNVYFNYLCMYLHISFKNTLV